MSRGGAGVGWGDRGRRHEDHGERVERSEPLDTSGSWRRSWTRLSAPTARRTSATATRRGDELPERFRSRESRRGRWPRPSNGSTAERERRSRRLAERWSRLSLVEQLALASDMVVGAGCGRVVEGSMSDASESRPVARSRAERLVETKRRLEEQLAVELAAHVAYETHPRARCARRATVRTDDPRPHPQCLRAGQRDRSRLARDAHEGAADGAGLQRADRGHREPDHHRRGDHTSHPISGSSSRSWTPRCESRAAGVQPTVPGSSSRTRATGTSDRWRASSAAARRC